jgi:GT2 family glycosyltransferase
MKLSIVIVTWNVKELVSKLLDSIFHFTSGFDYEVIIVDNQSKDGTCQTIKEEYRKWIEEGKLQIICNNDNAGFAKANNQGLKIAKGEYVVFMNPDMELIEDSFSKMVDLMNKTPNIGISTCRLLYGDKSVQKNIKSFPTFCSQLFVMLKMHHFFSWLPCLKKYLQKDFNYSEYGYVNQVMGAFSFTRKDLMNKMNGWDEGYWLWWEDVDLCKRVKDLGHEIVYTPQTELIHYEGKSFEQNRGLYKQKRFNKGMLTYFKKHHSKLAYLLLYLLQPISLFLTWLTLIFRIKQRPQSRI